jgi:hypothetical protein
MYVYVNRMKFFDLINSNIYKQLPAQVATTVIFPLKFILFQLFYTIHEGNTEVENNGYVVFKYNSHSTDQPGYGMLVKGDALVPF